MLVGYARVSTEEQHEARQITAFDEYRREGQSIERVYLDKVSGKSAANRPQLAEMIAFVRNGDTLIVESISRLARSTVDLLKIVETLTDKGVAIVSLKESFDTDTPTGKFMLTMFAAMAQLEREQMLVRQREGIEEAKKRGAYKGRQPIEIDEAAFRRECAAWQRGDQTATRAMSRLGLKPNTFYRRAREFGIIKD